MSPADVTPADVTPADMTPADVTPADRTPATATPETGVWRPAVALQTLREAQDRALHMEGIPMLIALADQRGGEKQAAGTDAGDPRHAAILARIDQYRAALAPSQRENDLGVIASVLTVAAYEDFGRIGAP